MHIKQGLNTEGDNTLLPFRMKIYTVVLLLCLSVTRAQGDGTGGPENDTKNSLGEPQTGGSVSDGAILFILTELRALRDMVVAQKVELSVTQRHVEGNI